MALEMLTKLNDICIFVSNIERSVKFYTQKLGFKIKRRQPGYVEFNFQGTSVTLWQANGVQQAIPSEHLGENGHHFMLAVRVPTMNDVDRIWKELSKKGVDFISLPETYLWGARAIYFKDIEGNIWEVFAWEKDEGPGLIASV